MPKLEALRGQCSKRPALPAVVEHTREVVEKLLGLRKYHYVFCPLRSLEGIRWYFKIRLVTFLRLVMVGRLVLKAA